MAIRPNPGCLNLLCARLQARHLVRRHLLLPPLNRLQHGAAPGFTVQMKDVIWRTQRGGSAAAHIDVSPSGSRLHPQLGPAAVRAAARRSATRLTVRGTSPARNRDVIGIPHEMRAWYTWLLHPRQESGQLPVGQPQRTLLTLQQEARSRETRSRENRGRELEAEN